MSKWIEFDPRFLSTDIRLVVPDRFDPDNEAHVQYLYDHCEDWAYPEVDYLDSVRVIPTPPPQEVRFVDGLGPEARVLRTEMRDPEPDGTIADEDLPA